MARRRDAGCQPAKQQITNLRYENREGVGRSFLFWFARDWDVCRSRLHEHLTRFDVTLLDYWPPDCSTSVFRRDRISACTFSTNPAFPTARLRVMDNVWALARLKITVKNACKG